MGSSLKNPVKNEVKTENVKTEENVKTDQYYRGEEDVQKNINNVYFGKKSNQIKQDHHQDIKKTSSEHSRN